MITDVFPAPLPNLYKGQQLILSGRYQVPTEVILHLSGKAFNLPVHYEFPLSLSDSSDTKKSFLPKIWAKQAIDQHTIQFNLADTEEDQNAIQAIIDSLSICYGVVSTQFTSFEDGGDVTSLEFDEQSKPSELQVLISPNPFVQEFILDVKLNHIIREDITILLVDANGKIILRKTYFMKGQTAHILVSLSESILPGPYYLVVYAGEDVYVEKVIKL